MNKRLRASLLAVLLTVIFVISGTVPVFADREAVAVANSTELKIIEQPTDTFCAMNAKVSTSVTAEGDGLKYQWYVKNPDKTTFAKSSITVSTYAYKMTEAKSGRQVYCVITDKYGDSVKSDVVTISLYKHYITLDMGNGEIVKQGVLGDGSYCIKDPVRPDCVFVGWVDEQGNPFNSTGICEREAFLTALWKLDGGKCGDNLEWELLSDGTLHIFGSGAMYDYVKFTTPSPWYKYRDEPYLSDDGVTMLNPDGSVYMKDSSYLSDNPNGYKIKRFKIDEGVTYIGDWAFYRVCVEELTFPEGVTETGIFCVRYSPTLKTLTLPDSLKVIDDFGISRNQVLTTVNFGDGLQTIGAAGLRDNYELVSVQLPESCTSINKQLSPAYTGAVIDYSAVGLMENCTALKYVDFGSVDEIPQRTCMGTSVETVVIPNTVKAIGAYAFYTCSSLKTVIFEEGSVCKSVHDTSFVGCSSLESVQGGVALESLGSYSGLKGLKYFDFSVSNKKLLNNQFYKVSLEEATVGENIIVIPSGWMAYSASLKTLYIADSVTTISANAFLYCTSLTDIHYAGTPEQWDAISKAAGWCSLVPSTCVVHFSDGTTKKLSKCK